MAEDEDKKSAEDLSVEKKKDDNSKAVDAESNKYKNNPKKDDDLPAKDEGWDRNRDQRGGPGGQPYPPQEPYYPPPQPLFTSGNLSKLIGLGVLICIIMLFVGALLTAGAYYIEPKDESDFDTQRNLLASAVLVSGIGLFILGLLTTIAFMQIRDLSDKQRLMLGLILVGTIFAFSILIR